MNGAKLDLFGLYRSVASRGGFPTRESRAKLNWTKDVFPDLNNYTENHRATSAGHDLIGHYQNYLLEYEEAHPDDITTRHTEVDERAEGVADERAEGAEGAKEDADAEAVGPRHPHDVARDDRPGAVAVAVAPEAVLAAPAASPRVLATRLARSVALRAISPSDAR